MSAFLLLSAPTSGAYSVLTHEQIIDFAWGLRVKPLLLERYPNATPDQLRAAHAYAYGGSLIQDMGYYPFGSKFFSDLLHYVRSGDFVVALLNDSQDMNSLAFALGSLGHYASDITGHPAVNASVSLAFPKLRKKYGDEVTYEDDRSAHVRTEFGFDVLQVSKQLYSSDAFHDFIGFEVARPLLERAFQETYGLPLTQVLPNEERSIESFRRSVSTWMPRLTQAALLTKKKELEALPNFEPRRFRYLLSRADYERNWGKNYKKPWWGSRLLAVLVKLVPKIGPLKNLDIKAPTPQTERMYIASVEETVKTYDMLLTSYETGSLQLPNDDYDTGKPTIGGEYDLADQTYSRLLRELAAGGFAQVNPELRANLLAFYSDLSRPIETKKHQREWKEVLAALHSLQQHP